MKEQTKVVFISIGVVFILVAGIRLFLWPVLADVHFKKGLKAVSQIEYARAVKEFQVALNYKKEPVYYESIAKVYREMGISTKKPERKRYYYEQSIKYYKKLLLLKPNFALGYNALGGTCLYMGKDIGDELFYKAAIENFKKAIELRPDFIDAYVNLATAYYLWGLKDKAVSTYLDALRKDPLSTTVLFNLGMLHYLEKNYGKAEEYWKNVLEIEPENLDAKRGLKLLEERK